MWRSGLVLLFALAAPAAADEGAAQLGESIVTAIEQRPRASLSPVDEVDWKLQNLQINEAMRAYDPLAGGRCAHLRDEVELLRARGEALEAARLAQEAALECPRRESAKALRIAGANACYKKDHDAAVRAWNRLGQMDRQFVKYICNRNGIVIP